MFCVHSWLHFSHSFYDYCGSSRARSKRWFESASIFFGISRPYSLQSYNYEICNVAIFIMECVLFDQTMTISIFVPVMQNVCAVQTEPNHSQSDLLINSRVLFTVECNRTQLFYNVRANQSWWMIQKSDWNACVHLGNWICGYTVLCFAEAHQSSLLALFLFCALISYVRQQQKNYLSL